MKRSEGLELVNHPNKYLLQNVDHGVESDQISETTQINHKLKLKAKLKGGLRTETRSEEWESEKNSFNNYLFQYNREVFDVEGDGNCLFHSICDQITNEGEDMVLQRVLRSIAARQIERNPSLYQPYIDENEDIQDHFRNIRLDGVWGELVDIRALSNALNWMFVIFIRNSNEEFENLVIKPKKESEDSKDLVTIYLLFSTKFKHYMSAREIPEGEQRQRGRYYPIEVLGRGSTGIVYSALDIVEKRVVAVKEISEALLQTQPFLTETLRTEVEFLQNCTNPNVVKFLSQENIATNLYLLYEFCEQGTLEEILQQRRLSEEEALQIFVQILNGYEALYSQNIVHRDLKPENILIHNGVFKLADLGFCYKIRSQDDEIQGKMGSIIYLAPEILLEDKYNSKCDIWSLGVILYRMLYSEFPIYAMTTEEYADKINISPISLPCDGPGMSVSEVIKALLLRMLEKNPKKRISWVELLRYGYLLRNSPLANFERYKFTQKGTLKRSTTEGKKLDEEVIKLVEMEYNLRKMKTCNERRLDIPIEKSNNQKQMTLDELMKGNQEGSVDISSVNNPNTMEILEEDHGKNLLTSSENEDKTSNLTELSELIRILWSEREERSLYEKKMANELTKLREENMQLKSRLDSYEYERKELNNRIMTLETIVKEVTERRPMENLKLRDSNHAESPSNKISSDHMELENSNDPTQFHNKLRAITQRIEGVEKDIDKLYQTGNIQANGQKCKDSIRTNERFTDIEKTLKGINLRLEKIAWTVENQMEESKNLRTLEDRIADIEGWRINTVSAINKYVIPAVSRLQDRVEGIQKRIDTQNRYIGNNRFVYGEDGEQLNIRIECLQKDNYDDGRKKIVKNPKVIKETNALNEKSTLRQRKNQDNRREVNVNAIPYHRRNAYGQIHPNPYTKRQEGYPSSWGWYP